MADGAYWDRTKETRSRAEREAEVLANLQRQLHDVYERLPFYRAHYDKHGFRPEQVRTLDDFAKRVPIITKPMLRDDQTAHGPFGRYLGCEPVDIIRVHGSSGTSGKPTLYAFSRDDWDYVADVMAQGLYTCGVRPGDVVQLATVFSLFMGGWGALLGVERLGATAFPLGAGETERQLESDASDRLDGARHHADLCAAHARNRPLARLRHRQIAVAPRHIHRRARLVDPRNAAGARTGLGHQGARHGHDVGDDSVGHQRRMRGGAKART